MRAVVSTAGRLREFTLAHFQLTASALSLCHNLLPRGRVQTKGAQRTLALTVFPENSRWRQ